MKYCFGLGGKIRGICPFVYLSYRFLEVFTITDEGTDIHQSGNSGLQPMTRPSRSIPTPLRLRPPSHHPPLGRTTACATGAAGHFKSPLQCLLLLLPGLPTLQLGGTGVDNPPAYRFCWQLGKWPEKREGMSRLCRRPPSPLYTTSANSARAPA